jgi:hypothetical protein
VTNIEFSIELFSQRYAIGYRMVGKIGKVRGTKNIFHLYSHGTFSPFARFYFLNSLKPISALANTVLGR